MTTEAGTGGGVAGSRFLDPDLVARLDDLALVARIVVDGFVSGMHRALHLGVSTDFAEHRGYAPGDDVRRIDWRVFGRTDRLYIKTFEAETNAAVVIALDVSRSMAFASRDLTKLDYARFVAASIAWLGARQRDRIGLATFDADLRETVPPAVRHRDAVLHALERSEAGGAGDLPGALARIARGFARRRGIVVVISDLYDEPDAIARALDELRLRGHEVIVFQILDPLERDLDLADPTVLEDLETGERLPVVPARVRAEHRRLVREHVAAIHRMCGERRIDHACFDTSTSLDEVLVRYLAERTRLARVR